MKQYKALLIKEWKTNWSSFLLPVWVSAGVYVVALIGWIISLFTDEAVVFNIHGINLEPGMENLIAYGACAAATALLGFVSYVTTISLMDTVVNGDNRHRCGIFHFSQPVTFAKIASSKYDFAVKGGILLFGAMSLVNMLVIMLVTSILTGADFYYGFTGWLQTWIVESLSIILIGSMFWFFAGLYRKKSFLMALVTIFGIEAAIGILNYTTGWHIPSLTQFLGSLISLDIKINPDLPKAGITDLESLIRQGWQLILNWKSVLKVALGVVFFVAGSYLYKRRELT